MGSENIFTVTVMGAYNDVREYVSDCVLVIAHGDREDFNMSFNVSSNNATTLMLLEAMDQAKQQLLDSDPELEKMYNKLQMLKKGDGNA